MANGRDELLSVLQNGTLEEVLTIIDRLQNFLPEYGRTRSDQMFSMLWKEVDDLERQLKVKRAMMREQAIRILESAKRNWTQEEIEKASGYTTQM